MTSDELRRKTLPDRLRGSYVVEEIPGFKMSRCFETTPICHEAAAEIDRLTARVAELECPQDRWPIVDERDGHRIAACPVCASEHIVD